MPPKYKSLVDQLIPDMKNQVNGQAFADIEDGFQGKVNRVTKKISEGISKGTGGFVHADIKVDVELNESFERLGQVGRSALDGEKLNTIFTTAFPSDQAREQALYAGQGQQTAALPAANGPWSVKVPGVAYMRFVVHGGNLQGDNMMQIRILPPRASQAMVEGRPHLILAGYEQQQQSTPSSPSVISLFNGSVNDAALSQCQAIPVNQQMCTAQAITVNGNTGYSIGTGAQAPIMVPAQPLQPTDSNKGCQNALKSLAGIQLQISDPEQAFIRNQTCIVQASCEGEGQTTVKNQAWLNTVIEDFVTPLANRTGDWPEIIEDCQEDNLPVSISRFSCQQEMADYHISVDLQKTLNDDGCGSDSDWSAVAVMLSKCIAKGVNEDTMSPFQGLAKSYAEMQVIKERDAARQACIRYRTSHSLPIEASPAQR